MTAQQRPGRAQPWPGPATAEAFDDLRPLLFAIAYRMLGSVTEAEDIVQEAFLRYHRVVAESDGPAGPASRESPKAYLSAVTTRLCIDHARSARVRRETYVGQWLPEPVLTDLAAPGLASCQGGPGQPGRAVGHHVDGLPAAARAAVAGRAGRVLAA